MFKELFALNKLSLTAISMCVKNFRVGRKPLNIQTSDFISFRDNKHFLLLFKSNAST